MDLHYREDNCRKFTAGIEMAFTDEQLSSWTKPAFDNEEEKASSTEAAIRAAVKEHPILKLLDIDVFAKGSYKNNTNVRRDSDIDVAVHYKGMIQLDYMDGLAFNHTGLASYSGPFREDGIGLFKFAVGQAMRTAFGPANVDGSGNRVFKVKGGQTFLKADVVPCTTHRLYYLGGYHEGIRLILDRPDGKLHYNYPHHHNDEGIQKNNATSRRYKSTVRILKNIRNQLGLEVPSYFIECLAFNVGNPTYMAYGTWREIVRAVAQTIWNYAVQEEPVASQGRWIEVSRKKYLFHDHQTWNRVTALMFSNSVLESI